MAGSGDQVTEFRTWHDVLTAQAEPPGGVRPMGRMAVAIESSGVGNAGPLVDRYAGEGPPPCCTRRRIGADMLVWYGGVGADALARVRAVLPHLDGVADEDVYLCDGCRSTIEQAGALSLGEMPRAWPLEVGDAT